MGRDGAGASTTRSQAAQANLGRTWRITLKLSGTYSSCSLTSSPNCFRDPPQSGQHVCFGSMRNGLALKMRGQGLAPGPRLWRDFRTSGVSNRFRRGLRCLQLFQFQLELFQLNDDLLALLTEDRAPQLLDQQLQMFDLLAARAQFIALFGELLALRSELGFQSGQLCLLLSCGLALLPQFAL